MNREHRYQTSCSPEEIAAELHRGTGTQFDPLVVQTLLAILTEQTEPAIVLLNARVNRAC